MGRKTNEENIRESDRRPIVLAVVSGILVVALLTFLFLFRVTTVTVEGNIHYTEEEIRAMAMDGIFSSNSVLLSMTKKHVEYDDVPFLESISVDMIDRNTVCIEVTEKNVVGYVEYENACWYVDRSGTVVEQSDTPVLTALERVAKQAQGESVDGETATSEAGDDSGVTQPSEAGDDSDVTQPFEAEDDSDVTQPSETGDDSDVTQPSEAGDDSNAVQPAESDGTVAPQEAEVEVKNYVPNIQGLEFSAIELGEKLDIPNPEIFETLYSLNQMINKDNIPPDYVYFDSDSNLSLYYGSIVVQLGPDEQLEEKMRTLASIMPKMEGMSGTLHLEEYQENQSGIVFERS